VFIGFIIYDWGLKMPYYFERKNDMLEIGKKDNYGGI